MFLNGSFFAADGTGCCSVAIWFIPSVIHLGNGFGSNISADSAGVGFLSFGCTGGIFGHNSTAIGVIGQIIITGNAVTAKGTNLFALTPVLTGGLADHLGFVIMIV